MTKIKVQKVRSLENRDASKKKNNKKYRNSVLNTAGEFFKGLAFSVGPYRPELYLNIKEWMGLYASTQIKNGFDITKCLLEES